MMYTMLLKVTISALSMHYKYTHVQHIIHIMSYIN